MTIDTGEHFRHAYTKDRRELLTRLARIEGQVRGIRRLVEEEAYCLDVLQQVDAMTAASDAAYGTERTGYSSCSGACR